MPVQSVTCFVGLVFLALYSWIGMRNFDLQMANFSQDDGAIFYSLAFEEPARYKDSFLFDFPVSQIVSLKMYTSLLIWLPAILWHHLEVDPYWTTWWLALIQGLMLVVAIYSLTLTFVGDRMTAILAVVFACVAIPWGWDPANYGVRYPWNFRLYPGFFVLIPILFSIRSLMLRRFTQLFLLLILAMLIHPGLALQVIGLFGIYWVWNCIRAKSIRDIKFAILLIVVATMTVLVALTAASSMGGTFLPTDELFDGMQKNQHLWPWGYEGRWGISVSTTIEWFIITLLSLRVGSLLTTRVRQLWAAGLLAVLLLSLSQVVGAVLGWPWLLNLIGLRSWSWFSLISLPLVMFYWTQLLRRGRWTSSVFVLLSLLLPFYCQEYGLFWALIGGLVLLELSRRELSWWWFRVPDAHRSICQALAVLLLVGWSAIFLLLPTEMASVDSRWLQVIYTWVWDVDGVFPPFFHRVVLLLVVYLVSLLWGWGRTRLSIQILSVRNVSSVFLFLIMFFYTGWFLHSQWEASQSQRLSSDVHRLEAQMWVRKHTPESAFLVIPGSDGWRTMARRRVLDPFTRENYAYVATLEAKQHRNHLLYFYGIPEETGRRLMGEQITQIEMDRFREFREKEFLRFRSEFGVTHLVLPTQYRFTEVTDLKLPILYRNDYYIVYLLKA